MRRETVNNLFGTDGIRSKFGEFPLEPSAIRKIGNAVSQYFNPVSVLLGRDTRESGERIAHLLSEGFNHGCNIEDAGVIPTPGLSWLIQEGVYDIGIMITASHNPWFDNGIKIFGSSGEKITDEEEREIEKLFFTDTIETEHKKRPETLSPVDVSGYRDFLVHKGVKGNNRDLKILLDCANGAASGIAPEVFEKIGYDTSSFNTEPDGININDRCGSTFPGFLKQKIASERWGLGIAFDGDADRILIVDRKGRIINGDLILFILAKYFKKKDKDFPETVVGTIMSNLALENELKSLGFRFIRSNVGDRSVYKEMNKFGSALGGEQSGHIIIRNLQKTGDGILTAIIFLNALNYLEIGPDEIFDLFIPFPQLTESIKIKEKRSMESWTGLNERIRAFRENHGNNSRIIVRYSGTEPKIRLMIESEDMEIINKNMEIFKNYIISEIGE
ncbi:MAG: phosphoglucosamine mutase [Acidobacteriota bacterium]